MHKEKMNFINTILAYKTDPRLLEILTEYMNINPEGSIFKCYPRTNNQEKQIMITALDVRHNNQKTYQKADQINSIWLFDPEQPKGKVAVFVESEFDYIHLQVHKNTIRKINPSKWFSISTAPWDTEVFITGDSGLLRPRNRFYMNGIQETLNSDVGWLDIQREPIEEYEFKADFWRPLSDIQYFQLD